MTSSQQPATLIDDDDRANATSAASDDVMVGTAVADDVTAMTSPR